MTGGPVEQFKAVAHPTRFAILQALAGAERNVGEIESATSIGQPLLSQQLSVLRKAGLVQTRRDAKLVYYRIEQHALDGLLAALHGLGAQNLLQAPPLRSRPDSTGGAAVFARIG
jgi:DNA-binding transcriptional ArsR family regulator